MADHILESNRPNLLVIQCQRCKAGKLINTEITADGYLAIRAKADEIMDERKQFIKLHSGDICYSMILDPVRQAQEAIKLHI